MKPQIITTHNTCRFFIEFNSKELDPKHFCRLKSRVKTKGGGYLNSCADFTAIPFPYREVLDNLKDNILTEEEVSAIQREIILYYNKKTECYNCHH